MFDDVYGTSAGAMNASYFVTGQARLGIRIYYEDMNRRAVVNPLAVLADPRSRPPVPRR